jgi:transposase InsO family protein
MRRSVAEKRAIIELVEHSALAVDATLKELDVPRSSFYRWYQRYQAKGIAGLETRPSSQKQFWNHIPPTVSDQIVQLALANPEKSARQIAWTFTDQEGYFVSESSVFRLLKRFDLIASPAFEVITAADKFGTPTKNVNELWQTDFTYFKIAGWGWYYLSTVMDDYLRYLLAWKLTPTMAASDVQATLEMALTKAKLDQVRVRHRPRLLSDNGPCYLSKELKAYLARRQIEHTRGAPFHPMTQGKIERYHRSLKNIVLLQNYFTPWDLEREIARFVKYYNDERYHESLNNLTPADMFHGRAKEVLTKREEIKQKTLDVRRRLARPGQSAAVV